MYGKALLEVYDVERHTARVPRIVLAPSAVSLIEGHMRFCPSKAHSPHNRDLLRDRDGMLFLDYLSGTIFGVEEEAGPFGEELVTHRDTVVARLQEFRSDPNVWPKYGCVGRYHNYSCDTHEVDAQYKIPEVDLAATPALFAD